MEKTNQVRVRVPIKCVLPSPTNPRKRFNEEAIRELADTIDKHGLLHPVLVRKISTEYALDESNGFDLDKSIFKCTEENTPDDIYEVISGERRFRAMRMLEWEFVECEIRDNISDLAKIEIQFIENIQRADVSPLDECEAYKNLLEIKSKEHPDYSIRKLAKDLGKSAATIGRRIRLADLSEQAKGYLDDGTITVSHALELTAIPSTAQDEVLEKCISKVYGEDTPRVVAHSVNAFRIAVQKSTMLLSAAEFDPKLKSLVKDAKDCASCPFNTSCNITLFDNELNDDARCTNRECFDDKTRAHRTKVHSKFMKEEGAGAKYLCPSWYVVDEMFTKAHNIDSENIVKRDDFVILCEATSKKRPNDVPDTAYRAYVLKGYSGTSSEPYYSRVVWADAPEVEEEEPLTEEQKFESSIKKWEREKENVQNELDTFVVDKLQSSLIDKMRGSKSIYRNFLVSIAYESADGNLDFLESIVKEYPKCTEGFIPHATRGDEPDFKLDDFNKLDLKSKYEKLGYYDTANLVRYAMRSMTDEQLFFIINESYCTGFGRWDYQRGDVEVFEHYEYMEDFGLKPEEIIASASSEFLKDNDFPDKPEKPKPENKGLENF